MAMVRRSKGSSTTSVEGVECMRGRWEGQEERWEDGMVRMTQEVA